MGQNKADVRDWRNLESNPREAHESTARRLQDRYELFADMRDTEERERLLASDMRL